MKYVLISGYDVLLEAFMPPQVVGDITDEDIIESHRRAVLAGSIKPEMVERLVVFKLGTFDDKTGEFTADKHKLVCLSTFLPRKEKTEVKEDGANKQQASN